MNVKKISESSLKQVCSVTELAKSLGISRGRFYQLCRAGVFPSPIYDLRTRRPYYTVEQQEICIQVRQTNIGHNGLPILFYTPRQKVLDQEPKSSFSAKKQKTPPPDLFSQEILMALQGMGLRNVTSDRLKEAFETLFPGKRASDLDQGLLLRDLFRYFKSKVSP